MLNITEVPGDFLNVQCLFFILEEDLWVQIVVYYREKWTEACIKTINTNAYESLSSATDVTPVH